MRIIAAVAWPYLWYVIRHRWFVMMECFKRRLVWRGIIHDLSKFRPSEFVPYMWHFAPGIKTGRDETGYYKPTDTGDSAFDLAWFHHQARNDHHWQYWVFPSEPQEPDKVIEMSWQAATEMVCDWIGASRAQQATGTVQEWYARHGRRMLLGTETRGLVEQLLAELEEA